METISGKRVHMMKNKTKRGNRDVGQRKREEVVGIVSVRKKL